MNEDSNGRTGDLNSNSNIRIPIGVLAGIMASASLFLYAQDERLHDYTDERFRDFESRLDNKADKTAASDRYTGSQAAAINKSHEAADQALQRELVEMRQTLQREIDHIHDDLDKHLRECKLNHNHE